MIQRPIKTGYHDITPEMSAALDREDFLVGIELWKSDVDDIYSNPAAAEIRLSKDQFRWGELDYQGRVATQSQQRAKYDARVTSYDELRSFIGAEFNRGRLSVANTVHGAKSGSSIVLDQVIRGYRIGFRMMFPSLPEVKHTRLFWWGRIDHVEDIDDKSVSIFITQEIGDYSYELPDTAYGTGCPLNFCRDDCLGTETLEQKSPLMRAAFERFGQGGCNRTYERCDQLQNTRFYQGQRQVAVSNFFVKEEKVTKRILGLWLFKKTTIKRTNIPYSSKNMSDNNSPTPEVVGVTQAFLTPFTWADTGARIIALMAACRGPIADMYGFMSRNAKFPLISNVIHYGRLGGEEGQQKPGLFPDSGYNSRLAYTESTFDGSSLEEAADDPPALTAIIKGRIFRTPYTTTPSGTQIEYWKQEWTHNPIWIAQGLMEALRYQIVRPSWFQDNMNIWTADRCYTPIEDDTNSELSMIHGSEAIQMGEGTDQWQRYRSSARFDADVYKRQFLNDTSIPDPVRGGGDIQWYNFNSPPVVQQKRTYLTFRFTCNGIIKDATTLHDILWSWIFPTFRGYLRFNQYGKIEIRSRTPADNTYVRANANIGDTEIPVINCQKWEQDHSGYIGIGIGRTYTEVRKVKGVRYVNGCANTVVTMPSQGGMIINYDIKFQNRNNAPAEVRIKFTDTAVLGQLIHLQFKEPTGERYTWDYAIDDTNPEIIAMMFKTRLEASPVFRETWSCVIDASDRTRIIIKCMTGYLKLDEPLLEHHEIGEEILRAVEVYENCNDGFTPQGKKDNITNFKWNIRKQEVFHAVTATYINAARDFAETQIQPRVAWDLVTQERKRKMLELDLRFVTLYRQAAWLVKSAGIEAIDANLWSSWTTGVRGFLHEEGEVVLVRNATGEGALNYAPFTIEEKAFNVDERSVGLVGKLYLSAAFDERVAEEEKFIETSLTPNTGYNNLPEPILAGGGYGTSGSGDGSYDPATPINQMKFEPETYAGLEHQMKYSPQGRDLL